MDVDCVGGEAWMGLG